MGAFHYGNGSVCVCMLACVCASAREWNFLVSLSEFGVRARSRGVYGVERDLVCEANSKVCMCVTWTCWAMAPSKLAVWMNILITLDSFWRSSVSLCVFVCVSDYVCVWFTYVDWAVSGFPPLWEGSRMSLRKRLSFKRVWNFNAVSTTHIHKHTYTDNALQLVLCRTCVESFTH